MPLIHLFGQPFTTPLAVLLAFPLAYLDPGTGSYILQLVIGALVGGLLLVKIYFKKIKEFAGRIFNQHSASKDEDPQP